jgi:CRP/FNR family transcriptional regulator
MELTFSELESAEKALRGIDFLKDLPDMEIKSIAKSLERFEFKQGQTVLFQGEISNRLYFINKGKLSVIISKKGQKSKVADLKPGDYFGEMSLLEPIAASATIKAEEPTVVDALDGKAFRRVLENIPSALETISQKIAARRESMKPKDPAAPPEQK